MPIIEGADLTSVSTDREPLTEGEYLLTVLDSEYSEDKRFLIIHHRIDEGPERVGQKWQNWINVRQNDGKTNEIGLATLKRYLETVFGKGSPESKVADSDPLHGHQIRAYISVRSWQDKGEERKGNNIKKMFKP